MSTCLQLEGNLRTTQHICFRIKIEPSVSGVKITKHYMLIQQLCLIISINCNEKETNFNVILSAR